LERQRRESLARSPAFALRRQQLLDVAAINQKPIDEELRARLRCRLWQIVQFDSQRRSSIAALLISRI
jgi:hypothetical protein